MVKRGKGSSQTKRDSERLHRKFEADARRIEREKEALRRIEITSGDEVDLGCKSSGWREYEAVLKDKLILLQRANIRGADEVATTLNKTGFKTGSGRQWTPRLVNIAKVLGIMGDRLVGKP